MATVTSLARYLVRRGGLIRSTRCFNSQQDESISPDMLPENSDDCNGDIIRLFSLFSSPE